MSPIHNKQASNSNIANAVLIKDSGRTSNFENLTEESHQSNDNQQVDPIAEEDDTDSDESSPDLHEKKKKERRRRQLLSNDDILKPPTKMKMFDMKDRATEQEVSLQYTYARLD